MRAACGISSCVGEIVIWDVSLLGVFSPFGSSNLFFEGVDFLWFGIHSWEFSFGFYTGGVDTYQVFVRVVKLCEYFGTNVCLFLVEERSFWVGKRLCVQRDFFRSLWIWGTFLRVLSSKRGRILSPLDCLFVEFGLG